MSRAPLPSLRTLFASGGGPLAFVREDEQLTERLARLVRDDVPAIVEQGVRATRMLTDIPDLAQLSTLALERAREMGDALPDESEMVRRVAGRLRGDMDRSGSASAPTDPSSVEPGDKVKSRRSPGDGRIFPQIVREITRDFVEGLGRKNAKGPSRKSPASRGDGGAPLPLAKIAAMLAPKPDVKGAVRDVAKGVITSAAGVARILGQVEKDLVPSSSAKGAQRGAAAKKKPVDIREIIASIDAVVNSINRQAGRRATARGSAGGARRGGERGAGEGVATPSRSGRSETPGGETSARSARVSASDYKAATPVDRQYTMSEPITPVGGFRGLAQWAAEQSGDAELSAAIDRTDRERAPMLQPMHASRRGWGLEGDALALTLDDAARSEGVDIDEVAS